jgi:hypothetical protein
MKVVVGWFIRDGLLAYIDVLKQDAREEYRFVQLACALGGGKPPEPPSILKAAAQ